MEPLYSFLSVFSLDYLVAIFLKGHPDQLPDLGIILCNQDCLTTSKRNRLISLNLFFNCRLYHRQIDSDGSSLTGFTVYINIAVMLFDYSVDHRQAKPGPFADFFCREKRIKY